MKTKRFNIENIICPFSNGKCLENCIYFNKDESDNTFLNIEPLIIRGYCTLYESKLEKVISLMIEMTLPNEEEEDDINEEQEAANAPLNKIKPVAKL